MISSLFNSTSESPSRLIERTKKIHEEMIGIYNEQIRTLQIRIAVLEDENKKLKDKLENTEDDS